MDQEGEEEFHVVEDSQHEEPTVVVSPDHPDIGGVLPECADDLVGGSALLVVLDEAHVMSFEANIADEGLGLGDAYIALAVLLDSTDGPPIMISQCDCAINTVHSQEVRVQTLSQRPDHPWLVLPERVQVPRKRAQLVPDLPTDHRDSVIVVNLAEVELHGGKLLLLIIIIYPLFAFLLSRLHPLLIRPQPLNGPHHQVHHGGHIETEPTR